MTNTIMEKGVPVTMVGGFNWEFLVQQTSALFGLSDMEAARLFHAPAAKLLAALPYYAECKNPDQLALLKLSMFVTAQKLSEIFHHRENQTVRERFLSAAICPDGKKEVIELVTDTLELLSIKDHITDLEADRVVNHPNPLETDIVYYLSRKTFLEEKIRNYPDKQLLSDLHREVNVFCWGIWA